MLPKAIDVWICGEIGTQTNVLFLEDKWHGRRIEQHFIVLLTLDSKRERLLYDVKL
jgi:hypothetical protein